MARRNRRRGIGFDADPADPPVPGESVGVRISAIARRIPEYGAPSRREQRRQCIDGEFAGKPAVTASTWCVNRSIQQSAANDAWSGVPCGGVCRISLRAVRSRLDNVGIPVWTRRGSLRNHRVFGLRFARRCGAAEGLCIEQSGAQSRGIDWSGTAARRARDKLHIAVSCERRDLCGACAGSPLGRRAENTQDSRDAPAARFADRV